jgi:hypothetical protein
LNAIVASSPRLLDRVRWNLRAKHYSIRTEEAYIDWRVKLEPSIRSNVGLYAAKRQWRTPALAPAHHLNRFILVLLIVFTEGSKGNEDTEIRTTSLPSVKSLARESTPIHANSFYRTPVLNCSKEMA